MSGEGGGENEKDRCNEGGSTISPETEDCSITERGASLRSNPERFDRKRRQMRVLPFEFLLLLAVSCQQREDMPLKNLVSTKLGAVERCMCISGKASATRSVLASVTAV